MLKWRKGSWAWIADGVRPLDWYAVKRHNTKLWVALYHYHEAGEEFVVQLGKGTFGAAKLRCREHAVKVKEGL